MSTQADLVCPRCGGRAAIVKVVGQGRGVRKFACQVANCRYEHPPFTMRKAQRHEAAQAAVRRRVERATPRGPHWTHEAYG